MNNKKIGIIFLVISFILILIFVQLVTNLNEKAQELSCFQNKNCIKLESAFSISHFAFGVIGFILALGIYLIIFAKGEKEIIKSLEDTKNKQLEEDKFSLILKGLDEYERKVMNGVKMQEGITQNTLRLRTEMSKAKLSYVLRDLEKKGLIVKNKKGKTYAIYLKERAE